MSYAVVLSSIPASITAGEAVSWTWTDSRFPAGDWTLAYSLVKEGSQIQFAAGSDQVVELPSATTAAYRSGTYSWQAHVSNEDGERYLVDSGEIEVIADFASQERGSDTRSHVKRVLDALEAAIEGRASKTQLEQTVGNVQVKYMDLTERVKLRDRYLMKYRKEQAAAKGNGFRQTIKPRFKNC